jgi:hypothetical protein
MPQYVQVRFRPEDQRGYTYHNDGEPVAVGDFVEVDARGSVKAVEVVHLSDEAPQFPTKAIIRKVEAPEAPPAAA